MASFLEIVSNIFFPQAELDHLDANQAEELIQVSIDRDIFKDSFQTCEINLSVKKEESCRLLLDAIHDGYINDSEKESLLERGYPSDFINTLAGKDGRRIQELWNRVFYFNETYDSMLDGEPNSELELIPALIDSLWHDDVMVRREAALMIGRCGPAAKDAVPALISALSDKDQDVRLNAIYALGKIGPEAKEAIPALVSIMLCQDPHCESADESAAAARAIGKIGYDENVIPSLVEAASNGDPSIRQEAVNVLGENDIIESEIAVDALTIALQDDEAFIKKDAALALGKMGAFAAEASPVLLGNLAAEDMDVRLASAYALINIGSNTDIALSVLTDAINHVNAHVRWQAVMYLADIGEPATPALEDASLDEDENVREIAIDALEDLEV